MREAQTSYKEKLFHPEDNQARAQAAQRGCAASIFGGFHHPSGQSPQQSGLISQMTQLGVGGWTRDLLRSLLA